MSPGTWPVDLLTVLTHQLPSDILNLFMEYLTATLKIHIWHCDLKPILGHPWLRKSLSHRFLKSERRNVAVCLLSSYALPEASAREEKVSKPDHSVRSDLNREWVLNLSVETGCQILKGCEENKTKPNHYSNVTPPSQNKIHQNKTRKNLICNVHENATSMVLGVGT